MCDFIPFSGECLEKLLTAGRKLLVGARHEASTDETLSHIAISSSALLISTIAATADNSMNSCLG